MEPLTKGKRGKFEHWIEGKEALFQKENSANAQQM
jgi:hypothetical protein